MPGSPPAILERIQAEFEAGYSNDQIVAGPYHMCLRTVQRLRRNWERCGTVTYLGGAAPGRPLAIPEFYMDELTSWLKSHPSAYLDEMAFFLWDEFELAVNTSTICRALKRVKWSRKKIRKIARQRSQDLRTHWQITKLPRWRADQLVFLDESAACERTGAF